MHLGRKTGSKTALVRSVVGIFGQRFNYGELKELLYETFTNKNTILKFIKIRQIERCLHSEI